MPTLCRIYLHPLLGTYQSTMSSCPSLRPYWTEQTFPHIPYLSRAEQISSRQQPGRAGGERELLQGEALGAVGRPRGHKTIEAIAAPPATNSWMIRIRRHVLPNGAMVDGCMDCPDPLF